MIDTGRAIRIALMDADKTQGYLAKRLGLSRQYTNLMIHRKTHEQDFLQKVADALDIDLADLVKLGSEL